MTTLYDVYLTGSLLPGFTHDQALPEFCRLFNATNETAERFLNGKPRRVKSGCSKARALEYRDALTKIGVDVRIAREDAASHQEDPAQSRNTPLEQETTSVRPASAEKAPDSLAAKLDNIAKARARQGEMPAEFASKDTGKHDGYVDWPEHAQFNRDNFTLAPLGTNLGGEPSKLHGAQDVKIPDYELAHVGEVIPVLPDHRDPLNPRTEHLQLIADDDN